MLKNNIYIVYPAGYAGSYVRWCLRKSESSTANETLDDPINKSSDGKFGGKGTVHLELRRPTHASIDHLMYWTILHKPKEKLIYLVNAWNNLWKARTFTHIMNMDRDPVIIHITDDKKDSRELGNLNAITKWPLVFDIQFQPERFNIDFYNLTDNLNVRNTFVNSFNSIFFSSPSMEFDINKKVSVLDADVNPKIHNHPDFFYYLQAFQDKWYRVRNEKTPHEVNDEEFIDPHNIPRNYYSIDLQDIYSDLFPERLENIISNCDAGDYNFDYVKEFHHQYVNCQSNLQYLCEIKTFRETKTLTDYLTSHPYIKAMIIREILPSLAEYDWQSKSLEEIIYYYQTLSL